MTTAENAWEVAKKTLELLQTRLDEIEVKLVNASSIMLAREKELR